MSAGQPQHSYRVDVIRSGQWWAIEVPELPGVFSQVRRLDQVDEAVKEAIAMMTDADEADVLIDVEVESGTDIEALLATLQQSSAAAEAAREQEAADRRRVIEQLRSKGLPNRDVATLIGLSHQRVAQILKAS